MKFMFFANTDWYLYNFRRSLALAAQACGYEVLLVSPSGDYGERLRSLGLRWQALAGVGWLVAFAPWGTRIGRIYLSPRGDGKPG